MPWRKSSIIRIGADSAIGIRDLIAHKSEEQQRIPRHFFGRRGHMNLGNDRSQHRRVPYLYEDMLT